jgi:hypothetical protein
MVTHRLDRADHKVSVSCEKYGLAHVVDRNFNLNDLAVVPGPVIYNLNTGLQVLP